jgi:GH18 family chitinase
MSRRRALALAVILCVVGRGYSAVEERASADTLATGPKWVSGYYAGWYWDSYPPSAVDMSAMTHFIFGRYAPGGGTLGGSPGQLVPGAGTGHNATVEDALVTKAHGAGLKAIAMIGGTGDGPGWVASTTSTTRAAFIKNILDKCVAKDYDGIDADWEDSLDTATKQAQLINFLSELRSAAAARPRYQLPNAPFFITFPGAWVNVNTDLPIPSWKATVASLVDQYNLMTYGTKTDCCGWDTWLWAALTGEAGTHPTSIAASIQAYVNAGVPRSKLGMGLGLYGSGYGAPVTGPRQPISGSWGGDDNVNTWADFYAQGMFSAGTYHFDTAAQAGYYSYSPARSYRGHSVSLLTTEDPQSIAAKGAWAKAGNCGGAIVWTMNYGYISTLGRNLPMESVKSAFLGESKPTLTVTTAGSGTGTVTSSPSGISCGSTCTATYASGTSVTLSAAAASGSGFSGWGGACTGTGACQVTMDVARSVTATFGPLSLSIGDVALDEGASGTRSALFPVTLSGPAPASVTVNYATANGTAVAGSDYTATSGTLTFAPGESSKTVAVTVLGDLSIEADEAFTVTLSGATGAAISRSVATGAIRNDDFPSVSIGDASVTEGDGGTSNVVFTATLSAPTPQTVSVTYATANGTAIAGSDYAATAGNMTFAPGTTSQVLAVAVTGDTLGEPSETFVVNLSSPVNATIGRAQGTGTIVNDDATGGGTTEAVAWKSGVGVSVSGSTLTKTALTAWGNAGAVSTKLLASGDGYVEVTASETTTKRMFGLGNGDSHQGYDDIGFAMYLSAGQVMVYENGTYRGTFGAFATGDKVRVSVESGLVRYRRNGSLLYASAAKPAYPLLVDTAFYTQGATLSSAVLGGGWTAPPAPPPTVAVVWKSASGVSVSGSTLTKTTATNWGNAGAVSTQSLPSGNGCVEVTASETTTNRMFGLSTGNSNLSYTDIDFALYLAAGVIKVYEGGTYRGTFGGFVTGDKLQVCVESGLVKYKRNGNVFYASAVKPVFPLLVDTALYSKGATLTSAAVAGPWQ